MRSRKILYLHGRPEAHKLHARFAQSVGSKFQYVDQKMRWQDKNLGVFRLIISWIVNAYSYPRKDYQYFLIDNLHMSPVLMKKFGLLRRDQKIVAHMGSHTLYFIYSGWYSKLSNWLQKFMLKNYDAIICEGKMAEELAQEILGEKCPPTYYTYLGPPIERAKSLLKIDPDIQGNQILFISSGPSGFRKHYKGLDVMVKAFDIALNLNNDLKFTIVGDWDEHTQKECKSLLKTENRDKLQFVGLVSDIEKYISESSLYLHCTRGDAFPTSSIEAMTGGLVPIVSNWTGTKQIVSKIEPELVSDLKPDKLATKINWYFNLSNNRKIELSLKSRMAVSDFTEENATKHYQETFTQILNDLKLND